MTGVTEEQDPRTTSAAAAKTVKDIKSKTRKHNSRKDKICILRVALQGAEQQR
ncbi:hypothetical protein [Flexibacterium corallicola]|uniref:hypothetical protein n=1 Tax=Flexibacterium corallicola TaxID=3037259 RepID=UPI00286EFEF4|nr:hypothetical protein [Pseudovibrio sp. M1P-2-3]